MHGFEVAEALAISHRSRPCFRKIDNLCARMKQDLIRPDSVLANINSQGIVWAVKDFIFVLTRIINAWTIIKGYYNPVEGLEKIKSAIDKEFHKSFLHWEESTLDFIEKLIKSFTNLDQMVQSQKANYHKPDQSNGPKKNQPNTISEDYCDAFATLFDNDGDSVKTGGGDSSSSIVEHKTSPGWYPNIVEDSEKKQLQAAENGSYFKTGFYKPIKKDDDNNCLQLNARYILEAPKPEPPNNGFIKTDNSNNGLDFSQFNNGQSQWMISVKHKDASVAFKINQLLEKVCDIPESQHFFKTMFIKNYVSII